MNRKSVTAMLLAVSIIVNIAFFVFAYAQKIAAETTRLEAANLMQELRAAQQEFKAELDQCEGLRTQSDQAREECERKVLEISNRK